VLFSSIDMGAGSRPITHLWILPQSCTWSTKLRRVKTEELGEVWFTYSAQEPETEESLNLWGWQDHYESIEQYHAIIKKEGGSYLGAFHVDFNTLFVTDITYWQAALALVKTEYDQRWDKKALDIIKSIKIATP
jgi:hypothetical protein